MGGGKPFWGGLQYPFTGVTQKASEEGSQDMTQSASEKFDSKMET